MDNKGTHFNHVATTGMGLAQEEIRRYAAEIGLDLVGVTTPEPFDRYLRELENRKDAYAERYAQRLETWRRMADPRLVLPDARAVLVVGYAYFPAAGAQPATCGRVGRIVAYGHLGILKRARLLCAFLRQHGFSAVMGAHRKEAAVRAGLGMIGKHGLVINPTFGSWVAYQSIVTNAPLSPDAPCTGDICGNCRQCLDACPTGALVEPHRLDPRRCVTCLLTSREIPPEQWPSLGSSILGCDVCQEACPKNREVRAKAKQEGAFPDAMGIYPPLGLILELDEQRFQREMIGPLQRKLLGDGLAGRLVALPGVRAAVSWFVKSFLRGREQVPDTLVHASSSLAIYQRNALLAAGTLRCAELRSTVTRYLADEELKPYAAWALERMGP
jgi:epoxyqueuosine reductase